MADFAEQEQKKKEELRINKCDSYQLYNDLQFPFTKIFIDTRNNDKYTNMHIAHAINVPLINDKDNNKDVNPEEILKQSLHQILKQQTYMISHVWFYGNNCDKIDSSLYIQLCEIIKNILLSQSTVAINILNINYNSFAAKFPFLCNNNIIISNKNNMNMPKKTETDLLLDQYLGIMLNINKDNVILYPSNIISDKLFLGNAQHAMNAKIMTDLKITHIVNCTQDLGCPFNGSYNANSDEEKTQKLNIKYLEIPIVDREEQKISEYFLKAFEFINTALNNNKEENIVFVHCMAGVSRSSTIVIAYLMLKQKISMVNALQFVKSKRHIISPNTGFSRQLMIFDQYLKHLKYDENGINEKSFKEFEAKNGDDTSGFNIIYYEFMDYLDQYFKNNVESEIIVEFINKYHLKIGNTEFWGKIINEIFLKQDMGEIEQFIDLILILFAKKLITSDPTKFTVYLAENLNVAVLNENNGENYCKYLGKLFAILMAKGHFKEDLIYIFCQLCSFSVDKNDDIGIVSSKENCGKLIKSVINVLQSLKRDKIIKDIESLNLNHLVSFS